MTTTKNKRKKLVLESGMDYGFDGDGNRICRGAKHGRRDILPDDPSKPIKLRMERLRWVDGDYDQAAAYWGRTYTMVHGGTWAERQVGDFIYCAWSDSEEIGKYARVFVRAYTHDEAKTLVRESIPGAKFYR